MSKPASVIMAAGISSRYDRLKQIDPVGMVAIHEMWWIPHVYL